MVNDKPRPIPRNTMPPPAPLPARRASCFVPQVKTFPFVGVYTIDDDVNRFCLEQYRLTGQHPIIKPTGGGTVSVIYFIRAEDQRNDNPPTGWWPTNPGSHEVR